jgi:hypothetical protein
MLTFSRALSSTLIAVTLLTPRLAAAAGPVDLFMDHGPSAPALAVEAIAAPEPAERASSHDIRVAGIALTTTGAAAVAASGILLATALTATHAETCIVPCAQPHVGGQLIGGAMLVPLGGTLLATGIALTAGSRAQPPARISILPTGPGAAVRLAF